MNSLMSAMLWVGVYLLVVTAPMFALLLGPTPPAGGFWWDFAMALGFAALAMLGVQFILTARFRRAMAPFGIDIIYYFHRFLAIFALVIVMLHYSIIRIDNSAVLGVVNPVDAPLHMSAARMAIVLFMLVIASSLFRRRLGIDYDRWRWMHALGTTIAFALAIWHVLGTGYYIDTDWKQALWTGYSLFWIMLIAYVRIIKPWRLLRKPYRVTAVRREQDNAFTLVLEPEGHTGMRFLPGQFAWLTLGDSPFALKEHPFSIASGATQEGSIEFGIKMVGDFTRSVKDVRCGQRAYLDGPYGAFSIARHPKASGYVFIAGGVGIEPIMSMLRTLADCNDKRPCILFYGNRRWERVLYREELKKLEGKLDLRVIHILGEPPEGWRGECGLLTQAMLERHLPESNSELHCFICGPIAMTQVAESGLVALGVRPARIHNELFEWV